MGLLQPTVVRNVQICREHFRLTLEIVGLPAARPGQFLHVAPLQLDANPTGRPFLRRAFSIGGLRSVGAGSEVDLIYRVVGAATHWMAGLRPGNEVSVLGPLGNGFEMDASKPVAWLVAGGVGLPPLLWWAEWLNRAGKRSVAFCGARSGDLLPLRVADPRSVDSGGRAAALSAKEFADHDVPVVLSTDDGSLGLRGTVIDALREFHRAWGGDDADVAIYCCGPERMMEAVARWSVERNIACQLCMEREMACGTGTCQSCVVPIRDPAAEDGWRYALCCTDGPVFDAHTLIGAG